MSPLKGSPYMQGTVLFIICHFVFKSDNFMIHRLVCEKFPEPKVTFRFANTPELKDTWIQNHNWEKMGKMLIFENLEPITFWPFSNYSLQHHFMLKFISRVAQPLVGNRVIKARGDIFTFLIPLKCCLF